MPWGCEQTLATGIGDFLHEPLDLQRQSKGLGAGTLQGLPWGEFGSLPLWERLPVFSLETQPVKELELSYLPQEEKKRTLFYVN